MLAVSAPVIRRPRDPISDDEAKEKRKEQNRQAQARARAKKKEAMSGGANSTSLQSIPEKKKPKMNEKDAKNIIERAVQVGKAKGEMRKLMYEKQVKELQVKAQKKLDNFGAVIENGKLAYINIEEDYDTFKKYIKEHYPDVLKKIEKYHSRTVRNRDGRKIYLKYTPYQDYDYFVFSYERQDKTITDFSFKIEYNADIRYSVYLNNQYWRMNYYLFQESQGIFTPYTFRESYRDPIDFKDGAVSLEVKYPEVPLEQNTDTIEVVAENKSLIRTRHLDDIWGFYLYEDWYREKLDREYSGIFKTQTISLGDPDPPSVSSKATSAPATIVKNVKSRKTQSAKGRLQSTSSASATSTISAWSDSSGSVMSSRSRSNGSSSFY